MFMGLLFTFNNYFNFRNLMSSTRSVITTTSVLSVTSVSPPPVENYNGLSFSSKYILYFFSMAIKIFIKKKIISNIMF